jgi:multidrug resistance efflux pump
MTDCAAKVRPAGHANCFSSEPVDIALQRRRLRPGIVAFGAAALLLAAGTTFGLARLRAAPPRVDSRSVWLGTVERSSIPREVRGPGKLVADGVHFTTAVLAGRVEEVRLEPGDPVEPDTIVAVLVNPEATLNALETERALTAAHAELGSVRAQAEIRRLEQQQAVDAARAKANEARRRRTASERLAEYDLVAGLELASVREQANEFEAAVDNEQRRLEALERATDAQVRAKDAEAERLAALYRHLQERLADLTVRAGASGVVQKIDVEPGQWVVPGTFLALITRPDELRAELRISETQARDVGPGQRALVDLRSSQVEGAVTRIEPAAVNGTVLVHVELPRPLPSGARPDLNVDGVIEVERLEDVLHIARPSFSEENTRIGLFRLEDDGRTAARTPVRLGRGSATRIEVLEGLELHDRVILSDMSRWDSVDRVRIE